MLNLILAGDLKYDNHEEIELCLMREGVEKMESIQGYEGLESMIKLMKPRAVVFFLDRGFEETLSMIEKTSGRYAVPVLFLIKSEESKKLDNILKSLNVDHIIIKESQYDNCSIWANELMVKLKLINIGISNKKVLIGKRIVKLIAIGASTGGTDAIYEIVRRLKKPCPPVLIAIHMPGGFTEMFSKRLDESGELDAMEAKDGDVIKANTIYVCPGGHHMSLEGNRIRCRNGEKINGYMPSIDVFFDSVAKFFAKNAIGIILTGMGKDGAKGILNMKKNGAMTIGQDEKTSLVYGMPKEAFEIGAIEYQLPIEKIADNIHKYIK